MKFKCAPPGLSLRQHVFLACSAFIERAMGALYRMGTRMRTALAMRFLSSADRTRIAEALISQDIRYAPGGLFYEAGLFGWEKTLWSHIPSHRRQGRVLLLGAGAGREIHGLNLIGELPKEVVALEPNPILTQYLAALREEFPTLRVDPSDVAAYLQRPDPEPFDVVWLGWGLVSHMPHPQEVRRILERLAQQNASAFLIASYVEADLVYPQGPHFTHHAGFLYFYDAWELQKLLSDAGWHTLISQRAPYPHLLCKAAHHIAR